MSSEITRVPSSSQTVGPYFSIGLEYLIDRMAEVDATADGAIEIRGMVLDRDGAPVPDAILEFWSAGDARNTSGDSRRHGIPAGFRRVATNPEGSFVARIARPAPSRLVDGRLQAPHAMVLVFARGLQRHLITRVYIDDGHGIQGDPVLLSVPEERRGTLAAKENGKNAYLWDVRLQGAGETVFFAW